MESYNLISFFMAGPKSAKLQHTLEAEIAEEKINTRVLEKYVRLVAVTSQGENSTLIRRVCATGVVNLSPCSGVGKPKKDTLLCSYHSFLKSIVLYCIVFYCIVLYSIVLYCIVLETSIMFMLYLFNQMIATIPP